MSKFKHLSSEYGCVFVDYHQLTFVERVGKKSKLMKFPSNIAPFCRCRNVFRILERLGVKPLFPRKDSDQVPERDTQGHRNGLELLRS